MIPDCLKDDPRTCPGRRDMRQQGNEHIVNIHSTERKGSRGSSNSSAGHAFECE